MCKEISLHSSPPRATNKPSNQQQQPPRRRHNRSHKTCKPMSSKLVPCTGPSRPSFFIALRASVTKGSYLTTAPSLRPTTGPDRSNKANANLRQIAARSSLSRGLSAKQVKVKRPMSLSSSSSSDFSAPPGRLSSGGGATSGGAGAALAATADQPQSAVDSSDDDASREMNVANVQLDQSPSSLRSNDAAGIAGKRDISDVDTLSKEPPPKKVAADPSKATAGGEENSATSTGGSAVPAPTATGGSLNDMPKCDPTFAARVNLDPVPPAKPLPKLSYRDIAELELALQIGDQWDNSEESTWREDWSGNLQLIDKELIMNKDQLAQDPSTKTIEVSFCDWATKNAKNENDFRPIRLLFSYIYHMEGTPPMAQRLLAHSLSQPAESVQQRREHILEAVRRISYDPTVLNEDGWTTEKAETPEGASGGAFMIGRRVIWERYEAIIIAYVHDEDLGDLWKAMWLEDLDTFDLEADELQGAIKKWEKRAALREKKKAAGAGQSGPARPTSSQRFAAIEKLTVDGIEHGIVLAASYHTNARQGILWPARILHVSEVKALGSTALSRRSSAAKNTLHAVFLAPYWNGAEVSSRRASSGTYDTGEVNADNPFCTGPLFDVETVEISSETITKYPCEEDDVDSINIDKLRASFRFLGLPKAAFPRYLDSHRIAMALKAFARRELVKSNSSNDLTAGALSSLTESHSLTVKTPLFPPAVLSLPFEYALSKLPHPTEQSMIRVDGEDTTEPVMKLHLMLKAMTPPFCWGGVDSNSSSENMAMRTPITTKGPLMISSPVGQPSLPNVGTGTAVSVAVADASWAVRNFASDYILPVIGDGKSQSAPLCILGMQLSGLLLSVSASIDASASVSQRKEKLRLCLSNCLILKGHGEDLIVDATLPNSIDRKIVLKEWSKTCERVYKRASVEFSTEGLGNGVTAVITDSRCNQHITANGSFERAVRLPAAISGAKKAGAGTTKDFPLINTVEDQYVEVAEKSILPKAHKHSYLKRLKNKIAALPSDAKGVPLTDDSDGDGGEDTMGSRGSFTAAVVGVAAALKATDMVVGGHCVNAFCAVRPPGHHAGRELRPMKAISNGFCLLNAAASAAIYATTPRSEGGLGLKRACVIDFDVHHGNGTQDILASTHDPRFLYVSLHAGGAHINGYDELGESDDGLYRHSLGTSKNEGIFPGRCGDTSPHSGVLNIPLGQKVTPAAVGQALVSQVSPAVEKFNPDIIILSAGFDAHVNDPLGMGGLTASDFGSVTDIACQVAFKTCSGRLLSVLEGGYGVPCCTPQKDLFLPEGVPPIPQPRLIDLGDDLPPDMDDQTPEALRQRLDRCHLEGFREAVQAHTASLAKSNQRASQPAAQQTVPSTDTPTGGVVL